MVTVWYRIGLYVSSFFPLYVLLYLDNIEYFTDLEKFKNVITFKEMLPAVFFIVLGLLILLSIVAVILLKIMSHNEGYSFKGINKTEDNLLSYVVTYLVPILSIKIDDPSSLLVNLGLFSLLGFIYVKNSLVYLNPLFLFFQYNIYKTEDDKVLISNYNINELKFLEGQRINVRKISYNIFLVRKEANNKL